MAMTTYKYQFGVDVAKDWLDISDGTQVSRIDNNRDAIKIFLKQFSETTCIAVESTSTYHELFIELAMAYEHTIYLVDAYRLSRYRDAVGVRAKTDISDAHLLHRYMCAEKYQLTPFKAIPKAVKRIHRLLKAHVPSLLKKELLLDLL